MLRTGMVLRRQHAQGKGALSEVVEGPGLPRATSSFPFPRTWSLGTGRNRAFRIYAGVTLPRGWVAWDRFLSLSFHCSCAAWDKSTVIRVSIRISGDRGGATARGPGVTGAQAQCPQDGAGRGCRGDGAALEKGPDFRSLRPAFATLRAWLLALGAIRGAAGARVDRPGVALAQPFLRAPRPRRPSPVLTVATSPVTPEVATTIWLPATPAAFQVLQSHAGRGLVPTSLSPGPRDAAHVPRGGACCG